MKYAVFTSSFIVIFAITHIQAVHAEEGGKISLETGLDYNSGKYGGTQSTDILYMPVTGKYQNKEWILKLTVPYLQITGPGNVINVLNGVGLTGAATTNAPITRSGLGDVVVAATHNTYRAESSGLYVNLTGKVKFGTASKVKGLGTGENDYALQFELFQTMDRLSTFGIFGYKVYGSPAGAGYKLANGSFGSFGGSYRLGQETSGGVMINLSQKITTAGSPHREAIFFASHKIEKNWKARGYALKGLTKSVPSWGMGANIAYLF